MQYALQIAAAGISTGIMIGCRKRRSPIRTQRFASSEEGDDPGALARIRINNNLGSAQKSSTQSPHFSPKTRTDRDSFNLLVDVAYPAKLDALSKLPIGGEKYYKNVSNALV
ncbi:hypothetical protein RB195_014345 [Necator americanus]|uniref:Uncharacterized protein n=1 Tax=Necator americanus TaxID=51031 RepID=A0ABR1DZS8_NECAM